VYGSVDEIETLYKLKTKKLYELLVNKKYECIDKKNKKVGLIILDEAQDICYDKMNLLITLGKNSDILDIYIGGDFLQTIYATDDIEHIELHSMNMFKQLKPKLFNLNICKRCPKGHVDFNNFLLKDIKEKYGIPPMISDNENTIDKPFIFTHHGISNPGEIVFNSKLITKIIETLIHCDTTLLPEDIVIIMAKSRKNTLFEKLEVDLNELYEKKGWKARIKYMSTEGDGYHNTLDWNNCIDKTSLISIHGDKGKGHKVVFFLGLTEKSIPKEDHIFKPIEIVSESLLNVGITRSLKYLFIGFNSVFPSRYLIHKYRELSNYAYCVWDKKIEFPYPYNEIYELSYFDNPLVRNDYKMSPVNYGNKSILEIKNDITNDFEDVNEFVKYDWKYSVDIFKTYNIQSFGDLYLDHKHKIILGNMTEILIRRKDDKEGLFIFLRKFQDISMITYSDNDIILSVMSELEKYGMSDWEKCGKYLLDKYRTYFSKNMEMIDRIKLLVLSNKKVIHTIFSNEKFKEHLNEFLSEKSNNELSTECIWNVNLLIESVKEYMPGIHVFYNYIDNDLSTLHENIDIFIEKYKKNTIRYELPLKVIDNSFSDSELEILGKSGFHRIGIVGYIDMYDEVNKEIYEIKASQLSELSDKWLIQTVIYYLMMIYTKNIKCKKIHIVNLVKGKIWSWELPDDLEIQNYKIIIEKIGKKYKWNPIEINKIIRVLDKYQEKFRGGVVEDEIDKEIFREIDREIEKEKESKPIEKPREYIKEKEPDIKSVYEMSEEDFIDNLLRKESSYIKNDRIGYDLKTSKPIKKIVDYKFKDKPTEKPKENPIDKSKNMNPLEEYGDERIYLKYMELKSDMDFQDNYLGWKNGISPITGRKIKIGSKIHNDLRDNFSFLVDGKRYYYDLIEKALE